MLFQINVKHKPTKCIYRSQIDGNKLKNTLKVTIVLILPKKNQITLWMSFTKYQTINFIMNGCLTNITFHWHYHLLIVH